MRRHPCEAQPAGPWNHHEDPRDSEFDIDVDLTQVLAVSEVEAQEEVLVRDTWYRLAMPVPGRRPEVQVQADRMLRNTILQAQWVARERRKLDRRRAIRVPLLARVRPDRGAPMISTDISLSGLCASGTPRAPVMDVEFKIPGLEFPIDARVEVVSYKDTAVIPLVGMRFVGLDRPYLEHIARYVADCRDRASAS